MALLVTGGCGFIGANFVRAHARRVPEDEVVVLDALTYAGNAANLDGCARAITVVRGDICDGGLVERVLAEHRVDRIVHCAAESHVDRSLLGPAGFARTNVLGTTVLLDRARAAGVTRFVHVSTDEVYGDLGPADPPFRETHPLTPRSPYSASKAGSDHLAAAWFATWGFPAIITRCSNNYGPYQFPEKLIPLMILRALAGEPLPVYGDGLNVRDWIHVEDHCAALEVVLERGRPGSVYNIGAGEESTNLAIVRRILELTERPDSLIRHVTDRPGHDRRYAIDARLIRDELGWSPTRALGEGLEDTVRWYREHGEWTSAILSGEYLGWYDRNYSYRLHR